MGEFSSRRLPPLKLPDPLGLLGRLGLSSGKAARLCGVTRRQLSYWAAQGAIELNGVRKSARPRYGWDCLARVLLLKQVRDQGRGVRRAKRAMQEFLRPERWPSEEWSAEQRMQFLGQQAQRLQAAAKRLRYLTLQKRRGDGGQGCARLEEDLAALAGWLQRARQGWASALGRENGFLADIDTCRRVALFADLLEARIAAALRPARTDEG